MICKNLSHAKIRWKHPFRIFQHKKMYVWWNISVVLDFWLGKKWIYKSIKKRCTKQCCLMFKQKQIFHISERIKNKTWVKRDIHKATKKGEFRYLPNFLCVCLIFCFNRQYQLLVIRSPHEKMWMNYKLTKTACCFIISFFVYFVSRLTCDVCCLCLCVFFDRSSIYEFLLYKFYFFELQQLLTTDWTVRYWAWLTWPTISCDFLFVLVLHMSDEIIVRKINRGVLLYEVRNK